ncbi:hypothetical protein HYPSUDRAFT_208191 [Hypholoma sublateritium FD-334 SS-4]|uniref:Uncharacterized protein n=1 Tax=Hypholoma sublateritium (strain FD-334 SS-4) TaxID=945553 RepID=A0A0D2KK81_HYPSF|nr:hypothetical protein HYPSUDRAFT_208191 [Hypholoma sublateritium FD-334 SS-4]
MQGWDHLKTTEAGTADSRHGSEARSTADGWAEAPDSRRRSVDIRRAGVIVVCITHVKIPARSTFCMAGRDLLKRPPSNGAFLRRGSRLERRRRSRWDDMRHTRRLRAALLLAPSAPSAHSPPAARCHTYCTFWYSSKHERRTTERNVLQIISRRHSEVQRHCAPLRCASEAARIVKDVRSPRTFGATSLCARGHVAAHARSSGVAVAAGTPVSCVVPDRELHPLHNYGVRSTSQCRIRGVFSGSKVCTTLMSRRSTAQRHSHTCRHIIDASVIQRVPLRVVRRVGVTRMRWVAFLACG